MQRRISNFSVKVKEQINVSTLPNRVLIKDACIRQDNERSTHTENINEKDKQINGLLETPKLFQPFSLPVNRHNYTHSAITLLELVQFCLRDGVLKKKKQTAYVTICII